MRQEEAPGAIARITGVVKMTEAATRDTLTNFLINIKIVFYI